MKFRQLIDSAQKSLENMNIHRLTAYRQAEKLVSSLISLFKLSDALNSKAKAKMLETARTLSGLVCELCEL
jgi:hypothetical protein